MAGTFSCPSAALCSQCVAGTFSNSSSAAACLPCAAGTFSYTSASTLSPCPMGTFSGSSAATCAPCAGTFLNSAGATSCAGPENLYTPYSRTQVPEFPGNGPCENSTLSWKVLSTVDKSFWQGGGLSYLMTKTMTNWMCIFNQFASPYCPSSPDLACYTFNSQTNVFAYWGSNSYLLLVVK